MAVLKLYIPELGVGWACLFASGTVGISSSSISIASSGFKVPSPVGAALYKTKLKL